MPALWGTKRGLNHYNPIGPLRLKQSEGPSNQRAMSDQTQSISALDPSNLHPEHTALFLDFDGTLAPIVEHPDAVSVPIPTMNALASLAKRGVLAIITGRSIVDIDRFLSPLELPVAGVHGLERRSADGTVHGVEISEEALKYVSNRLSEFVIRNPGLILESKRGSIALHFRQRPDLADVCTAIVAELTGSHPQLHVLPGKMVLEIKAGVATKGDAICAFMQEDPFAGRTPFFAGDDVTDEEAFPAVSGFGGITVRIGKGVTSAQYRCPGPAAFSDWLTALAHSFSRT